MLRISPLENGDQAVTLRLEGRIAGPWVLELRKACEKLLAEGRSLKLQFADVSFIDPTGVSFLSSLKSRGIPLEECSRFVEEQLKGG